MGQLRVAFRLARREARRRRLRTAAIVVTLALPIAVATTVDVVARTDQLPLREQLHRSLGDAQALVRWSSLPIEQAPNPLDGGSVVAPVASGIPAPGSQAPPPLPSELLPPSAVVTAESDAFPFLVSSRTGGNYNVRGVDITSPAVAPLVAQDAGRPPAAAGEVTMSRHLADHLGVTVGSSISIPGSAVSLRVVGFVHDRYAPRDDVVYALPATVLPIQEAAQTAVVQPVGPTEWYVASPSPVTWTQILQLNAQGFVVTSRAVVLHPPPRSEVPYFRSADASGPSAGRGRDREIGALLAGMVLLEIVLLAGPAFAVGARNRQYELALVSAAGGERRHLAGLVLADGVLLGAEAAGLGAAVGVGAGAAVLALLPKLTGRVPGPVALRPVELIGIASLAVVSGLVAAVVPALLAARQQTASVLSSGRSPTRPSWRPVGAGAVCLAAAVVIGLGDLRNSSGAPLILVAAAALGEVGCALIAPALLAIVCRLAGRLPLWPRLALRDASRNRSAAAPAVAAIIAVVAAAVAALIYGATSSAHGRITYQPYVVVGDGIVSISPEQTNRTPRAASQLQTDLPGSAVMVLRGAGVGRCPVNADPSVAGPSAGCRQGAVLPAPVPGCPTPTLAFESNGAIGSALTYGQAGPTSGILCPSPFLPANLSPILVDDGSSINRILGGTAGRSAADALRSGKSVVFGPSAFDHGTATMIFSAGEPARATVAAVAIDSSIPLAGIVIPPAEAARLNLATTDVAIYVKGAAQQRPARIRTADDDLARLGMYAVSIETGYHNHRSIALLAVTIGDLVLTLGAALAATALMAVDRRDDLITLAAVGATPHGRRRLAMARAGTICLVGATFGAVAGLLPGVGLVWRVRNLSALNHIGNLGPTLSDRYPLTIPWLDLGLVVLAAPLLATLAAAVLTRARLPSERRGAW